VRQEVNVHAAGAAQSRDASEGGVEMSAMSVKAAALILALILGATAEAGGSRVGFAVVVPVGPMASVVAAPMFGVPVAPVFISAPVVPVFTTTIIQQPVAPVFVPSFVPGFVPVYPQMVVPPAVPVFAAPAVVPHVPVMAPGAPLFFAPPVQTVIAPSPGGQIIIIRGSGF
jgi:hypothetical protein